MQQNRTSPPNRPSLRLVDSSIWIAFYRAGQVYLLKRLPDLAVTPGVLEELGRKGDTLRGHAEPFATDLTGVELSNGLIAVLGLLTAELGSRDAEQAVYIKHDSTACLYLRDGRAFQRAAVGGGDVRTWRQLLDDLAAESLLTEEERQRCEAALEAEFDRGRKPR